jgi:hypothetical protein
MLDRLAALLGFQPKQPAHLLFAHGTTVPADGTAGYATGCLFQHTDGGAGSALYVNEGTAASCNFDAVTVA